MQFSRRLILNLLLSSLLLSGSGLVWAQLRTLPANARLAVLNGYENPFVILGKERLRLAPGAVIYDTNNRSIVPVALPQKADVAYTTDTSGAVMRIYLLSADEHARLKQSKR